jgi:putative membrane protein
VAAGVAGVAAIALVIILVREFLAIARLAEVEKLQQRALAAIAADDPRAARSVVDELSAFVSGKPETAAGRRSMVDLKDEIIDGANLVRLAEAEILGPLDARAKVMILDAAKRVSLVTAVSPRALVDVAYVVFEAGRLIRRLSELYGGRPGTLGFFRLTRSVLAHLAVTGSIAIGDGFVQQIVGHGLAARLSAKLGEGVVNGMMTARIGIAAMETARPLPFSAVKRPGMGDFLAALTRFATAKAREPADPER